MIARRLSLAVAFVAALALPASAGVHATRGAASASAFSWGGGSSKVIGAGFDPAISAAQWTFTNSNRTATLGSSVTATAYVNTSLGGGKYYWEYQANSVPNVPRWGAATVGSGTAVLLGNGAADFAFTGSGSIRVNNVDQGVNLGAPSNGDRIRIAVDNGAKLLWIARNGGTWNNSGTANPATGTGGLDISGMAGNLKPGFASNNSGESAIVSTGALSIFYSVPSGFNVLFGKNP